MSAANMIVPSNLVSSIATGFDVTPSKTGYVAPTVYKLAGKTLTPGYNYYKSFADAFEKLRYICGISGAKNVTAAGSVSFTGSAAQTMGINVDFFVGLSETKWSPAHYLFVKKALAAMPALYFVCRFYKLDGTGPFYSIFDPKYFGLSATVISSVSDDKLQSMDEFYRSVALLRAQHNTLVNFINSQIKLPITPARQMTINEGQMAISNMRAQISTIKGLDVTYSSAGQIGFVMLAPIVWWAIAAVVAAWTTSAIVTEVQKTRRISEQFDFEKWAANHSLRIAQEAKAGNISESDKSQLQSDLTKATAAARDSVKDANNKSSMFGEITTMLKWGAGALIVVKGIELATAKTSSRKQN